MSDSIKINKFNAKGLIYFLEKNKKFTNQEFIGTKLQSTCQIFRFSINILVVLFFQCLLWWRDNGKIRRATRLN